MTHRLIRNVVSLLALLIIAIFVALLIYSQKKTPQHQPETKPTDKTIRIGTYNIYFGNNDLDTVHQAILDPWYPGGKLEDSIEKIEYRKVTKDDN